MRVALAAAAALMVAAPVYLQHQRAIETARQDEALLEQVQTEVSRSAPEPMQPLEKLVAWNAPSGQSGSSQ
jgi:biopolymer transport protein ExbB/TolQ